MGTQLRDTNGNLLYRTELDYDTQNRLVGFGETASGQNYKTAYTYDSDNRITGMTFDGGNAIGYTYDNLGRVSNRVVENGTDEGKLASAYEYVEGGYGDGSTTPLVQKINQPQIPFEYAYDSRGNIISEKRGNLTTTYAYDALGQLIRVNDPHENATWVYSYDRGGNILSKARYAYTIGELGTAAQVVPYAYGDANWKDKLTAYNGKAITYDAIGNPLTDGTWTYQWQAGRQLGHMSAEGTALTFQYDHNGLRTRKIVETNWYPVITDYTLHGKLISHMSVKYTDFNEIPQHDDLHFFYDAQNRPAKVEFNGIFYTYIHNLQGDIVGLLDNNGNIVVEYKYDVWGRKLLATGNLATTLGVLNPFRYRGYIYDEETGLYYLKDRYYNPTISRFLITDVLLGFADSILLQNVFSYAGNTPVGNVDFDGKCIFALIGGVVGAITGAICAAVSGGDAREVLASAAGGFVSGAFSGAVLDASVATGGLSILMSSLICGFGNAAGECVTQLISKGNIDDKWGVAIAFGTGVGFGAISAVCIPNAQSTLKPLSDMAYKEAFKLLDIGVPTSTVSNICNTINTNVGRQASSLIVHSIAYNVATQVMDTVVRNKISSTRSHHKLSTAASKRSSQSTRFPKFASMLLY